MAFFRTVWNKIKKNSFWKSVATLSAGQIIGQAIGVFSMPVIGRLYSIEAYGDYGVILSTATILIGFISLGLGSAIMVPKEDQECNLVLRTTYTIQVILSTLIICILYIVSPWYKPFEVSIPYWLALIFIYLYIITNLAVSNLSVYINRFGKNKVLFVNPLISAGCTLCLTIPLGLLHMESMGLMCASVISPLIACIHMFIRSNLSYEKVKLSDIKHVFKEYKDFVLFQYPANCVSTFSGQIPNQTLSNNYGSTALGNYTMCGKVFQMPMSVIATPIQTIYFRTVCEETRSSMDLSDFTYSLLTKLLVIGFIPVVVAMSFGENIFSFVLGEKWAEAGKIASILSLYYAFSFCYNCVTYYRVGTGRQRINIITSIITLFALGAPLAYGAYNGLSMLDTLVIFSIVNTIWQIVNCELNFICMKKHYVKWAVFSLCYCAICVLLCSAVRIFK